jgi:hypothetical protein
MDSTFGTMSELFKIASQFFEEASELIENHARRKEILGNDSPVQTTKSIENTSPGKPGKHEKKINFDRAAPNYANNVFEKSSAMIIDDTDERNRKNDQKKRSEQRERLEQNERYEENERHEQREKNHQRERERNEERERKEKKNISDDRKEPKEQKEQKEKSQKDKKRSEKIEDNEIYENISRSERKDENDLEHFKIKEEDSNVNNKNKKKKKKGKRKYTAYQMYLETALDNYKSNPGFKSMQINDVMKQISDKWSKLPNSERQVWIDKANQGQISTGVTLPSKKSRSEENIRARIDYLDERSYQEEYDESLKRRKAGS